MIPNETTIDVLAEMNRHMEKLVEVLREIRDLQLESLAVGKCMADRTAATLDGVDETNKKIQDDLD